MIETTGNSSPNPLPASAAFTHSLFGLDGLTAIVVGGTGTLGGAFSETLARAGAYTVVAGRNAEHGSQQVQRILSQGGAGEFFSVDSTSRIDLEKLRDSLLARGRTIDVLINGAGINSATPFLDIPDEEWDRIINVNLNTVRLGCQVFAPVMLEQKRGSIINIASVSAEIPLSRVFTYSASKAAVLNLTRNLAREWAARGVRVNALSPGFFPAEQNRKVLTPERVEKIMGHSPVGRFGSPEELAGAILLLASPVAGSYLTGANVLVDGGFTCMTI